MRVRHVKVKVGTDAATDLEVLRETRAVLGEQCSLRIDANGAWERDEALERLKGLESVNVRAVEQPLAANDIEGLVWLTARSPVPVIVDESIVSLEDARQLAARRACHAFNVRVSKCGGLLCSARIREVARRENLGCMLGAQVGETAILSAAGRHLATRTGDLWFLEGSYGELLLEEDVGMNSVTVGRGGRGRALRGPGLGVTVNEDILRGYVQESIFLGEGSCRFCPGSP
jgi:muconate cycloisomerase